MKNDVIVKDFFHVPVEPEELEQMPIPVTMISVYYNTLDYPGVYVARLWSVSRDKTTPSKYVAIADTLDKIREAIPTAYMMRFERSSDDVPTVVESWA